MSVSPHLKYVADWSTDERCSAMFNERSVSDASLVIQGHAYHSQHETPNDWQKRQSSTPSGAPIRWIFFFGYQRYIHNILNYTIFGSHQHLPEENLV